MAKWPDPPKLEEPADCPADASCLTIDSAVELGKWVRSVYRYHDDVRSCPAVHEAPFQHSDLSADPAPTPDPEPLAVDLQRIVDEFEMLPVSVDVEWQTCGQVNAFYSPSQKKVILCEELKPVLTEGQIRFVLAHEMSHAVIWQMDIPYTGSEEVAADELGAVMLGVMDHGDDVDAMGRFFLAMGREENPADPHPGDVRRGLTLRCLGLGAQDLAGGICTGQWDRAVNSWLKLLQL